MKLYYVFDSDYVEEEFEIYDGDEFVYEIQDEEAKEYIAELYKNQLEAEWSAFSIIFEMLDQLDNEGWINWLELFDHFYDELRENFIGDAMDWYAHKCEKK